MRMEDVKQVNNEAPMPQSDLRMLLLQEKKQKENQERAEKDKMERERLEKERRLRLEREKSEREKMEKIRKERDRLEQELREKENRLFGNKNNLKLMNDENKGSQPYLNRPYMGHTPYTPGPNLLNRNKPEVYANQAQTPNVGANRNNGMFNFFRRDRDEIEKNKVKPVLYAAPSKEVIPTKEIIQEVNVRRDISPIRDILARKERNVENPENKAVNNSAQANGSNDSARPSAASEKKVDELNEALGLQYKVEETKSDKTNHKASPSSNDVQVGKSKYESSNFKEKEKEAQRRKKVVSKEPKEKSRKKDELKEMIIKNENSNRVLDTKEARLAEIRSKLDEERKRMRDDINLKKQTFKKGAEQFDVEVFMPVSPALDEDEKDDFGRNDDDDEKAEEVQKVEEPVEEKHNLDMTVEEENLIDMIQEMQKIVDEAPDKDVENVEEENNKAGSNDNCEDRDDDEDEQEEGSHYQKDEGTPFKDISNLANNENRALPSLTNMVRGWGVTE